MELGFGKIECWLLKEAGNQESACWKLWTMRSGFLGCFNRLFSDK
jgi:hypothetical protein